MTRNKRSRQWWEARISHSKGGSSDVDTSSRVITYSLLIDVSVLKTPDGKSVRLLFLRSLLGSNNNNNDNNKHWCAESCNGGGKGEEKNTSYDFMLQMSGALFQREEITNDARLTSIAAQSRV